MEYSGVQWSTVEYSGVQWEYSGSTVGVQWEYSGVQWSTVEYSGVQWSTVEYSGVQWSTVEYSGSTVEYSGVNGVRLAVQPGDCCQLVHLPGTRAAGGFEDYVTADHVTHLSGGDSGRWVGGWGWGGVGRGGEE